MNQPQEFTIVLLPGMGHAGQTIKRFTSAAAFGGYIAQVRAMGVHLVRFEGPFRAVVEVLE